MFPLIYPCTRVKIIATLLVAIWVACTSMAQWSGTFDLANIIITAICGATGGYLWYRVMRWLMIDRRSEAADRGSSGSRSHVC